MPTRAQLLDIIHFQSELARIGLDLGEVMTHVVDRVISFTKAEGAAIELAEDGDMVYRATSGIAKKYLGLRLKQSDSISGQCVELGETLYCADSESDPRVNRQACRTIGLRSMVVVPLKYHERTVGILKAMSTRVNGFGRRDRTLLELLSEVIGASIHFAVEFGGKDLFYKATHDGLTDLANRSLFMDRLRNVLTRCQREQGKAAVAVIDMDGLKQVNDTFGHRSGDAVIREFAARIKRVSRQSDTVARIGGDEFAMILTPIELPVGPRVFLERFDRETATPFFFEERQFSLRGSVGVAVYPDDGGSLDSLIESADRRMYAAKKAAYARLGG
ncbi:sensor domain-containing diguanylate cyclase [uncultured Propionivibrio sp.]|uniref:sensor domain-containing diguanylate cyclase n=1 Tax=uncultured Propionivibrio sp. TaxID=426737 RepID=UPI0029BFFF70|nr:sensor domain-containing diguanylate cyclase [uncultured Propionivibrio sp.]